MASRSFEIDSCQIDNFSECYVIAEIGHNHQGSVEKAKDLFRSAKECGVNAVKLQKRDNISLYTKAGYDRPYENRNSYGPTYGAHREALEFGTEEYRELKEYARDLGLTMFATPFDFASADFLAEMDMPVFKIASGDLKNIPLMKFVAKFGKPMLVSTGGGTIEDVRRAYDAIMPMNPRLGLLQCTASYPCEPEYMNLRAITTFLECFPEVVVGLSDHQSGIALGPVAYTLGARVIEKHFTLNRAWKGTDHAFSLEPVGMRKLVRDLHRTRVALGDGVKTLYPFEKAPLHNMGKKLVAAHFLPAGHVLRDEDIAIKSPNDGLPPYELENITGLVTVRALRPDENITFDNVRSRSQAVSKTSTASQ